MFIFNKGQFTQMTQRKLVSVSSSDSLIAVKSCGFPCSDFEISASKIVCRHPNSMEVNTFSLLELHLHYMSFS